MEVAQFVDEVIVFPPARKRAEVFQHGGYTFNMAVLRRDPELLGEVVQLWAQYEALERDTKAAEIAELEVEVDALIEGAQRAKRVFEEIENELLAEARRHQKSKEKLDTANAEYSYASYNADDDGELLTRAQRAERDGKLERANKQMHKAALAESLATKALNNAINRRNDAANAAVTWEREARGAQSRLKSIHGQA
jgi:flagella basal body P-ring formation protein FlgA